jgi:hypothetical protein
METQQEGLFAHAEEEPTSSACAALGAAAASASALSMLDESLALISSLLPIIDRIQQLVAFEEHRTQESPVLPTLRGVLADCSAAFTAHGVVKFEPEPGQAVDEASMEVQRPLQRREAPAVPAPAASVGQVIHPGLRHVGTGRVLQRALVTTVRARAIAAADGAAASVTAAADGSSSEAPVDGTRHTLLRTDTLQGLALRYRVHPAAILRANRLPNAHALHALHEVLIPPPQPEAARPAGGAAAAAAAQQGRSEGCGGAQSSSGATTAAAPPRLVADSPAERERGASHHWGLRALYSSLARPAPVATGPPDGACIELTPASPGLPASPGFTTPASPISEASPAPLMRRGNAPPSTSTRSSSASGLRELQGS